MAKIYLSELPDTVIVLAQKNHLARIMADGIYTAHELVDFINDFPNQKIADLDDALDDAILEYIRLYAKGEINDTDRYYMLVDEQDERDTSLHTFESAREWLADFWENNPDDDMTDEDIEELANDIRACDLDELDDRLGGVGYYLQEIKLKERA